MVEVTEKMVDAAARKLCGLHFAEKHCRDEHDPIVYARIRADWDMFKSDARLVLEAALASPAEVVDPVARACSVCGKAPLRSFHMCDEDDGVWCDDCFDHTPCGNGEHGEGCPTHVSTHVFSETAPQQEPARLREALRAMVDVYANMQDGDGNPRPTVAAARAALAEDGL